jgi:hypothetical protein
MTNLSTRSVIDGDRFLTIGKSRPESQVKTGPEARILAKGKSSPKNQVKTVGPLETSMRFQCPEKAKGF